MKLTNEKLKTVYVKTEELTSRFEFDRYNLTQELNRCSAFNSNEKISIENLKFEHDKLQKDVQIVKEQSG